jgi:Skp family chaperone for outer membrane proteins
MSPSWEDVWEWGQNYVANKLAEASVEDPLAEQVAAAEGELADAESLASQIGDELMGLVADLIGITDARKCITEGDIGACVQTALNFVPWGKLFKAAKVAVKAVGVGRRLVEARDRVKAARVALDSVRRENAKLRQAAAEAKQAAIAAAKKKADAAAARARALAQKQKAELSAAKAKRAKAAKAKKTDEQQQITKRRQAGTTRGGGGGRGSAAETAAGAEAAGAASAGDHIVLGLKNFGLEETAGKVGGRTLPSDPAWQDTLRAAVGNPSTRFTVSLDGMSGSSTYSQVISAAQRGVAGAGGYTGWEMAQLYPAGRLGDTTFLRGGSVVENPFTP